MDQLIIRNLDVVQTIFSYLTLKEQTIVTQVCPEFQYIIVHCMWRYKYRHMKVYKLNGDTFIIYTKQKPDIEIGDVVDEYFVELCHKEFQKFLQLNHENITELELCDYTSNACNNDGQFCYKCQWKFVNLKTLILQYVALDGEEFEMIYNNCKNLETLHIKRCHNSNSDSITLRDYDNCHYYMLLNIVKILKEFRMEYLELKFSDYTLNLHDLLSNNNLKYLNLHIPLKNIRYKETPRLRNNSCEMLKIGNFNGSRTLNTFKRLYLNTFNNLRNLTIEGSLNKVFIDTQFIQTVSMSCPALKYLYLKRCLINVDNFGLLATVMDISFGNCMSLSWLNLKQLLALPHLQSFQTNNSTYTREFQNVSIPFSLRTLALVGNEFRFAQILLNSNIQLNNLKELIYYDGSDAKLDNISLRFPKLELLNISPHQVDLQELFHLTDLKTFKVPHCRKKQINFENSINLIKHPSLSELSLTGIGIDFSNELALELPSIKLTKLQYLTLDFDLFNFMLEFLLELLDSNIQLTLIVILNDRIADYQYYYKLVNNKKFRRDSIKFCGFKIDCKDFIYQPKSVERKLELVNELSDFRNVYFII